MTLDELLCYTITVVLQEASDVEDERNSECTKAVARLLDDAQDTLARESHCLVSNDETDFSNFTMDSGEDTVTLNERVFLIRDPVQMVEGTRCWELRRNDSLRTTNISTGNPCQYMFKPRTGELVVFPAVVEDGTTIRFVCAFMPLNRFSAPAGETLTARHTRLALPCQIPEMYQERLTDYVLWRATSRRDLDFSNLEESNQAYLRWQQTVLDLSADVERDTTPNNVVYQNPQV